LCGEYVIWLCRC